MQRLLAVCVLGLAVASGAVLAQDSEDGTHPVVEKMRGKYVRAMEQARKQYLRDLEEAWERARRYDNYDAEQAIRDELDRLDGDGDQETDESRLTVPIAGTLWTLTEDSSLSFKTDNTVVRSNAPDEVGQWRVRGPRDVEVRFPTGRTPHWIITLNHDGSYFMSMRYDESERLDTTAVHRKLNP